MLSARRAGKQPALASPSRRQVYHPLFWPAAWPAARASSSSSEGKEDESEWRKFAPTVEELFKSYSAFYDRSFKADAAKEWQTLWKEGWRPDRRPRWDTAWWSREKAKGRVQEDREVSRALPKKERKVASARPDERRPGVDGRRAFSTSARSSQAAARRRPSNLAAYVKNSSSQLEDAAIGAQATSPASMGEVSDGIFDGDAEGSPLLAPESSSRRGFESDWGSASIAPGSLIQFSIKGHNTVCIYLGSLGSRTIVINEVGNADFKNSRNAVFVLNRAISPEAAKAALASVSIAYSLLQNPSLADAAGDKGREARLVCVRALKHFERLHNQATGELARAGASRLYALCEEGRKNTLTSEAAIEMLLGPKAVTPVRVWAMHDILASDPYRFILQSTAPRESAFQCRPPHHLKMMLQVEDWLATDSKVIKSFLQRARQAIVFSRENPPTPDAPASALHDASPRGSPWTNEHRVIIAAMRATASSTRLLQDQPAQAQVAAIMKGTGLYGNRENEGDWPAEPFDDKAATLFLREIGTLPPWQTPALVGTPDLRWLWPLHARGRPNVEPDRTSEGSPPPTGTVDVLEDVRRDFGQLPVYVIDAADAGELDDGISIDPIDDSTVWVHVHVADPTADLEPEDPIATLASRRLTSFYALGTRLPMLGQQVVEERGWSLGGGKAGIGPAGQKCLTFSARLDKRTGKMLGCRVEGGVIRNVKRVTYDQAAELIGWASSGTDFIHVGPRPANGWPSGTPAPLASVDATTAVDIRLLDEVRDALTLARLRDGSMEWFIAKTSPEIHDAKTPTFSTKFTEHYAGMPSFSLALPPRWNPNDRVAWATGHQAQPIVSEFMILAGRIASLFAREHGLVMPFRGQLRPEVDERLLDEVRATATAKRGRGVGACDFVTILRKRIGLASGAHYPEPTEHFPLGLKDGYVRVTSPLRRFADLAAHWSIKHALQPRRSTAPKGKYFKPDQMRALIFDLEKRGKEMTHLEGRVTQAWIGYGLKDAMHRLKTDRGSIDPAIAERFDSLFGIVLEDPHFSMTANVFHLRLLLPELGVRATLIMDRIEDWFRPWVASKALGNAPPPEAMAGMSVPVRIASITPADHLVVKLDRARLHELHMIP